MLMNSRGGPPILNSTQNQVNPVRLAQNCVWFDWTTLNEHVASLNSFLLFQLTNTYNIHHSSNYRVVHQWWIIQKPAGNLRKPARNHCSQFHEVFRGFQRFLEVSRGFQRFPDNPELTDHTLFPKNTNVAFAHFITSADDHKPNANWTICLFMSEVARFCFVI